MRISDWSSDVCSSDLTHAEIGPYYVTWAIGHLLSDPLPPYYDKRYKEFRAEDLPIVPKVWAKVVVPKKKEKAAAIAVLMKRVRLLWHIGDPDKIGRAVCRERVCYDVLLSVVADPLKKKQK